VAGGNTPPASVIFKNEIRKSFGRGAQAGFKLLGALLFEDWGNPALLLVVGLLGLNRARRPSINLLKACPVASGVDTLHLHCDYQVRPTAAAELEALKAGAERARDDGGEAVRTTLGGLSFVVEPRGTGKGPYLLSSDEITVIVHPTAPKNLPTVILELRAVFLWAKGHTEAVEVAKGVVRELTLCSEEPELQVSRLDVAVDFTGWQPRPEHLEHFVCRAQRKAELYEQWRRVGGRSKVVKAFRRAVGHGDEKAKEVLDRLLAEDELTTGVYYSGRLFTGFGWGAGAVVARLYLKTREIVKTGKMWMVPIWQRGGYRGGPVWRLEFQLRRELLKEACAEDTVQREGDVARYVKAAPRALVDVETGKVVRPQAVFTRWSSAAPNLTALWRYLLKDWLSLRKPRTADVRVRLASPWVVLREATRFPEQQSPEVWRAKLENDHLRTLGQQAGYMARGIAERLALDHREAPEAFDPDATVNAWVQEVRAYARGHSGDVIERALERWDGIQWRRRLYGAGSDTRH
jgi:hypothetical protein